MKEQTRPDFVKLSKTPRSFQQADKKVLGQIPTIAITPVADGRRGAYDDNLERTWRMVEKVYDLVLKNVRQPDGSPIRVVVAPEIVYGARSAARAFSMAMGSTSGLVRQSWVRPRSSVRRLPPYIAKYSGWLCPYWAAGTRFSKVCTNQA